MQIQQSSEQVKSDKWRWSIWLSGDEEELEQVERVVYHLHPTFAKPVVERTDRATGFRLDATGWGTFTVKVEVFRKNQSEPEYLKHRLRFDRAVRGVFICSATGDLDKVRTIQAALESRGIQSSSSLDNDAVDFASEVGSAIDRAGAVVLVQSAVPSRWVMQELELAKSLGKQIICVGSNSVYDVEAVRIVEIDELAEAVDEVLAAPTK